MSIQQTNMIDGIGIEKSSSNVVMLISDDMGWDDYQHIPLLTAKIEAYANAATSNQIAEMLPNSEGKPVVIRLVYKHLPHAEILSVLNVIADQLSGIGIGFEHTVLPYDY